MGGMKADSREKSTATRSTGDIIIQKDRRLLQAVCGGVCVYMCVTVYLHLYPTVQK